METPCSMRRVTRSQTAAAANNNKNHTNPNLSSKGTGKWEDMDEAGSKARQGGGVKGKQQQEVRSALLDITNDSPIVGLAVGSLKTPLSSVAGKVGGTPGSGEALLRSQVKTLLQKVEEDSDISKVQMESRIPLFRLQGLVNGSPSTFFAPTPTNTPQVSDGLSESDPIVSKEDLITKVLNDIFEEKEKVEDSVNAQIGLVTRSLLLDFSEKPDVSNEPSDCSSDLTFQGGYRSAESKDKSAATEDDNASIWSIQVNGSSTQDAEYEIADEEEEDNYCGDEEEEELEGSFIDELCNGMEKMFVNADAKFEGKHTRFVYDSDDQIVHEDKGIESVTSGIIGLKGMPTPRGKHTRFPDEADE